MFVGQQFPSVCDYASLYCSFYIFVSMSNYIFIIYRIWLHFTECE